MFSWGDGARGKLASPLSQDVVDVPQTVHFPSDPISDVSCGEQHSLFVSVRGQVISYGHNNKGQLGRVKSSDPKVIDGLEGVVAVACGQDHSLALCGSGEVYSWGRGDEGQLGVASQLSNMSQPLWVTIQAPWPVLITQVACGNVHSLALSSGGDVFSWGKNTHGQLGLGKAVAVQPVPCLVSALTGVPVTRIAAGGSHTLALTLQRLVYCCGANHAGQLGLKRVDEKGRFAICSVPALRDWDITSICCGQSHTAVLTRTGHVYTFGEGAHGQLGHSSTANELLPRKVEGLDGPATQIACGSHHTLVLGSSKQLWAFGSGVKGQLGNGTLVNCSQPVMVEVNRAGMEIPTLSDFRISAGWNSNFAFYASFEKGTSAPQPIEKLSEAQIQKWLTMSVKGQKPAETERVFSQFSSSSRLVGSFTKDFVSESKMTANSVRMDLQAASKAFDDLLQVPWIRKAIELSALVGHLCLCSSTMKAADVFLVLPLCPLLHEAENVVNLVLPLAVAITNLSDAVMETLRGWWASMGKAMMSRHILAWKQAISFLLRANLLHHYGPGVKATLEVLKGLYRANKKAAKSEQVPITEFYIEELGQNLLILQADVTLWRQIKWKQVQEVDQTPPIFCRFPFLLDLQSKLFIYHYAAEMTKTAHHIIHQALTGPEASQLFTKEAPTPVIKLKIRRNHLLDDTFRQLSASDHENFEKELCVQFVDESKLTLVNQKDFFLHVFDELRSHDFGLFMYNDTETLLWFPPKPQHENKMYFHLGILCGLALNNNNIVHVPFPLAMFKKLLGVHVGLEDLTEFSPVLGKSLHYILYEYIYDDIEENLNMTYSITWDGVMVELDPKEKGKLVTSRNKKEFVQAYVDYALNKSVEKVFEEFKRGFFKVCARDLVELFHPEELREMLVGREDYDWEILRQNTAYEGEYHGDHPVIKMFWEVFDDLTEDQQKSFLLFVTGCDRVPIGGMDQIRLTIRVRRNSTPQYFPESLTCHAIFDLPMYQSKETLKTQLSEALNHNRGFWKE
ncbi:probable E3 ubiquitin-protein ligase HERC4 [Engraulis encrasicolus]|uniref:probable E3 ubiquitin-protein ligase HERC4 n=1 Tax=Engraulis encrasicolus TaxID=184585 RepID=UPI002FCEB0CA